MEAVLGRIASVLICRHLEAANSADGIRQGLEFSRKRHVGFLVARDSIRGEREESALGEMQGRPAVVPSYEAEGGDQRRFPREISRRCARGSGLNNCVVSKKCNAASTMAAAGRDVGESRRGASRVGPPRAGADGKPRRAGCAARAALRLVGLDPLQRRRGASAPVRCEPRADGRALARGPRPGRLYRLRRSRHRACAVAATPRPALPPLPRHHGLADRAADRVPRQAEHPAAGPFGLVPVLRARHPSSWPLPRARWTR
jgi:hypothetical protein